ncbi:hypothetical protein WJX73_004000 [Symbiochloris irregularis]|uniref:Glutaredoxin domain-containing protein n=1 Tax=Symbiochloris irregularis TaxID=706552 RepID=A0AAW1NQX5_9CHLO
MVTQNLARNTTRATQFAASRPILTVQCRKGRRARAGLTVHAFDGIKLEQNLLKSPVLLKAVNALSVFITKSPLNDWKKQWFVRRAGEYDREETQKKIQDYIDKNPVVMFSWTGCTFCQRAKALLNDLGASYTAVEMDERDDGMAIKAELGLMTNRTSVPNIFIRGKTYGGMNDGPGINSLHSKGELLPLLQQAGVL